MTAPSLFTSDDLAFIRRTVAQLERRKYSQEQLDALSVAFFGLPELPEHLSQSKALLAWQERIEHYRMHFNAKGYGDRCEAVLDRYPDWLESVEGCGAAYKALRDEALCIAGGAATQTQLEEIVNTLAKRLRVGLKTYDEAALCSYLLDLKKPVVRQSLTAAQARSLLEQLNRYDGVELEACLVEARRAYGALA